jgi:hydrogenase maturation factor
MFIERVYDNGYTMGTDARKIMARAEWTRGGLIQGLGVEVAKQPQENLELNHGQICVLRSSVYSLTNLDASADAKKHVIIQREYVLPPSHLLSS